MNRPPTAEEVYQALQRIKKSRGLSFAAISDRLGLADKSSAHRLERGNPRLSTLLRYLAALDSTLEELSDTVLEVVGETPPHRGPVPDQLMVGDQTVLDYLATRYLTDRFERLRHDPAFREWVMREIGSIPVAPSPREKGEG